MSRTEDLTLTLHGLDEYNHAVDAEVFARKFAAFMKGLAVADEVANGGRCHKYLISDLKKNTATAKVHEQLVVPQVQAASGIQYYTDGLKHIARRNPERRLLPDSFIKATVSLSKDVGKHFRYAEVKLGDDVLAVVDDEFLNCALEAQSIKANDNELLSRRYKGSAFGSFDGVLELVDIRHGSRKAKLTLTAGGLEIECQVGALDLEDIRPALGQRSMIFGLAKYDGTKPLPVSLDARKIEVIKTDGDLARWRGQFLIPDETDAEEDWW